MWLWVQPYTAHLQGQTCNVFTNGDLDLLPLPSCFHLWGVQLLLFGFFWGFVSRVTVGSISLTQRTSSGFILQTFFWTSAISFKQRSGQSLSHFGSLFWVSAIIFLAQTDVVWLWPSFCPSHQTLSDIPADILSSTVLLVCCRDSSFTCHKSFQRAYTKMRVEWTAPFQLTSVQSPIVSHLHSVSCYWGNIEDLLGCPQAA